MSIKNNSLVPIVVEKSGSGERSYDIFSRLLKDRIIFVDGEINDLTADLIVAQMLFLTSEDSSRDIDLYINSPGGSVTAGLAIYDTIKYIKPDVRTICLGQASSMAAIILSAGTKGKRCSLPSSRIMLHQPWGGASGQASDISIQANEIYRIKQLLIKYLATNCGKKESEIERDLERDFFMNAKDSIAYGIIDKILTKE